MTHLRRSLSLLAIVPLVAACTGPATPLRVGTQMIPVAVVLGQRQTVQAAPLAPAALPVPARVVDPVSVIEPGDVADGGPATTRRGAAREPVPCPDLSPVAPVTAATPSVSGPVQARAYRYRSTVVAAVGPRRSAFAGDAAWTVGAPSPPGVRGERSFDIAVSLDGGRTATTTTYVVAPSGLQVENPVVEGTAEGYLGQLPHRPTGAEPGIYVQTVRNPDGSTFRPAPPMLVAPLPLVAGTAFDVLTSDGATTVSYVLSVGDRVKVNACGTALQGWKLDFTDGRYTTAAQNGTSQQATFTRSLVIAPQFGGLPIDDRSTVTGTTLPGEAVTRTEAFTISGPPPG